jgi:hypothetical protein
MILQSAAIAAFLSFGIWHLPSVEKWRIERDAHRLRNLSELQAFTEKYDLERAAWTTLSDDPRTSVGGTRQDRRWMFFGTKMVDVSWEFSDDGTVTEGPWITYDAQWNAWEYFVNLLEANRGRP